MSMDHSTLKQLARLKFTMRQEKIGTLDLERYTTDDVYARAMLDRAEEADNEEIVTLAVELRHKRGLLNTSTSRDTGFTDADGSPTRHTENPAPPPEQDNKSGMMSRMFGRRKPVPSKAASTDKEGDGAESKYMFGPRG